MRKHGFMIVAFTLLTSVTATACSDEAEPQSPGESPPVITTLEQQGFEVFGEFDAPGGLRGFAGVVGQRPVAVYVTPDGEHAVAGTLLNAKGEDVAAAEIRRLVVAPLSEKIWSRLEQSHWVNDGDPDAPRVVYVFTDPNCPYCHRFWEASRPWVDAGKVQLRHILVGIIKADSANKAAAILSAPSPPDALTLNEQNYDDGGIQGVPVTNNARAKLRANEQLMVELGIGGTPGILFRDADGLVQRRAGLPPAPDLPVVLGPR